ncbi:FAD-dependent monooxygenase [Thalassotalea marina]|uniref:2-octaprenyl-6-methoxyphenol hydroxylase n=1 Tax=Thalassotalea marina TaxID=1673741 RepID=A0A919BKL9_9GAMM|nr:FAD-dependent monooxygenase [Thalassotalea marina]GHF95061.1 2-octaprenyl-6-methoxyphenol hydroxylase [Thalassotalea marina]
MQKFDVLIVGGGMVGLATALALRLKDDVRVAIVDTQPLSDITDDHDVRVSALNEASQQFLKRLDVWQAITEERHQAYQHMHVWDSQGYGHLDFNIDDISAKDHCGQLGWIIENSIIRRALWQRAQQDNNIVFFTQEKLTNLAMGESEVFATFATQAPIVANYVVGADGARSWVREQCKIALTFRDYDHHALVATVKCQAGHNNTAWQVFLPTGPLAFLPLASTNNDLCSIVWSTSPEQAQQLQAMSESDFNKALTAASDGKLGRCEVQGIRQSHPLTMRYAREFVHDRIILVGDAAHTIHPLAGQGVNLGFLDASALAQMLTDKSMSASNALAYYQRWRKADAMEMIAAMESIKQAFTPQNEPFKFVRGIGMSLINKLSPAKKLLIKQALGYRNNLPELSQIIR